MVESVRLSRLLGEHFHAEVSGSVDRRVSGVFVDPDAVTPGGVFVEVSASAIGAALRRGAAAVVTARAAPRQLPAWLTWIRVPNPEAVAGILCARSLGDPSEALRVFAVTGTNGKTTVSTLLYQLFRAAGLKAGLIGTVAVRVGRSSLPAAHTTPPPWVLQALFDRMKRAACTHVAIEATSHALSTKTTGHRLAGTRVRVAGFTNLSRDHLDFHKTFADYRRSKARLFDVFAERACFNIDDPFGAKLATRFKGPRLTVAISNPSADLSVDSVEYGRNGTRATLIWRKRVLHLSMPLVGRFNLENALVALGMAQLGGLSMRSSVDALASGRAPEGRLQVAGRAPSVFVDYAHTPDGLENVLNVLRPLTRGRLICVFGAGGDRDRPKRPLMGAVASRLADVAIVTSDNPRSEDPRQIIDDIASGASGRATLIREPDRADAIKTAIAMAENGDTVLIAGKGHEKTQQLSERSIPFDDVSVARALLRERRSLA